MKDFKAKAATDEEKHTSLNILIIEDSEDDTELLLRQLKRSGYEPSWQRVETAEAMRDALHSRSWQVVVSDYSMPHFDGLHALSILQEMELDIPFIIVSAKIGEEIAVQAMKAGATDYIMKDNLSRLVPAIEREMREALLRSQHRHAEVALKKSDERLRLALDATGMGSWEFDVEKREFFWSENIQKIFALEQTQHGDDFDSYIKFIHPEDREPIIREVQQFLKDRSDASKYWEHRIVSPDGEIHWIEVHGRVISEDGKAVRMVGTAQDITERKNTEAELHHTSQQLRALAAHLQSVREDERTGIAREIHDELGQVLTALKMDLAIMGREISDSDTPLGTHAALQEIASMQELIDGTIKKIRTLITKLRPEVLDSLGLIPALEWQAQEFQERTGLHLEFHSNIEETESFEHNLATAVFRIFQEALTNIARHANAKSCTADIYKGADSLSLTITDDGSGIEAKKIQQQTSFGLLGMKERALSLGGSLNVYADTSGGTVVELSVPLTIKGS